MDDQKKVDNVVKIFAESLKESKDFPDSKIDNVARTIVQVLSQLYDPSKKEFRDKVNVLKMKLKGSRNNSARLALLQDKIQPADFVNLPQEKHNQEYFDSLISSSDSQSKPTATQAPPTRVNNQAMSNQIRGNAPPPRGISRSGGARVMPPQPNSFRPIVQQSQAQNTETQNDENNKEQNQNLQKDNIEENDDTEQKQIASNPNQQVKEISQFPPKANQDNIQQTKKIPANQNIQAEETPEKVSSQQSKVNKQQTQIPALKQRQVNQQEEKPQTQQIAHQQQQEEGEEQEQQQQQLQQQNFQAPPIARASNPISGRTNPQNQQSRLKQLPGQKKVQQQIVEDDQKMTEQVKLPPVSHQQQEEQKPNTKLQATQKSVQIQEKQNNSSQQQAIKNLPTKQNEEIPKQSQKSQQPQSTPLTQPQIVQIQDINKNVDNQKAQQQFNAKNNLQNNQSIPTRQQNQAPTQQIKQQQINQQASQLQNKQNQQRAANQPQQPMPANTQQQNQFQQQKPQEIQKPESYSDEEGECEDAHVSQLKSQLDDFKRTKQQLEAEYYVNEQILNNLSNEDEYSQYDDDESYEDPNKLPSDDMKNNQDDQYSDEYEVQQKQVSPQKQVETSKQAVKQVEVVKNTRESNIKQKSFSENQKQDRTHEYQLHQQIENQKVQEELQKKQVKSTDIQPPQVAQKANNPTHNTSQQNQQQNINHQIDTHFTTSQSSKQTQSKQKLEEMSDFEKIEFNPALRNEEFDDQNEEDVIHHIQSEQKNHNFDQKNGGFANPFQIQVPQKSHQRTISNVVVKQEDQESIDRLKNVQVPAHQSVSPKANQIKSGSKKVVKGPDGEQIEVTNSDNEDFASDNMQNILQGLTDQEQSKKGSDKESADELQGDEQERDELLEGEEQKLYQDEINVDIDIPADFSQASEKKQLQKNSPAIDTLEENESTKQQKSRKESAKSESQHTNQKQQQQYVDDLDTNNAKDVSEEYESDGELKMQNYPSSQNARLQEENKQLKAKLHQILQEHSKREELNKRALIEKDKKNKLLEQQVKETQNEINIIKQYLDEIIKESFEQKQQYEEMKLSFGQNEHQLREELSQLKQKIKAEYTNEIQQFRSVNQVLIQNNEHLQSALDSLVSDLEQKDLIIQKLTLHSSEQVNRSYQNINSRSLNYSSANTVQPPQQMVQQKPQPNSYIQQQQQQQQQAPIQPQQLIQINYPLQKQAEEQMEYQPIQHEEEEEENNHEEIEMNAQAELELDLQQHTENENDVDNHEGIDEQGHENIDKEAADLKNYEQEQEGIHNHLLNEDEGDDKQEGKHEEDIQDHKYDDLDQNVQQIQAQEQISQSSPAYHHSSQNQNQQQYDDSENFFNQLLPGTKQQTPILEPSPVQQQEVNKNVANQSGISASNQTKTTNKKSNNNNNANPSSKNQKQLLPNKKDSLSEQIVNLGGIIGDDIHNQSNSNFFDINSIPNVPTTSELRSSHNNKISNQKQVKNQIDLNPAENTFFSTENDFFNTVTSDKFNTSNISAIPNPFNTNNFFNSNFGNPFQEPQQSKATNSKQTQKRVRNTGGNLFQ
ncbi:hypothetical protein ABPG72_000165 [Tetrahymena utriculariae]